MKLKKHPETEMEYWEAIEGLGGFLWRMNHDLSDGRIEDPNGGIAKELEETRLLQASLAEELPLKFGVILPKDCPKFTVGEVVPPAPENKTYYRDWYDKMKKLSYEDEYETLICSACPFSEGLDRMISLGGSIPCKAFHGSINRLVKPFICAMVYTDSWDEVELHNKVLEASSEIGLAKFKEKEKLLMESYLKKANSKKS